MRLEASRQNNSNFDYCREAPLRAFCYASLSQNSSGRLISHFPNRVKAFIYIKISDERNEKAPKFFDFPRSGKKEEWKKLGNGNFGEVSQINMSKKRSPFILSRVQRMGLQESDHVGKVAAKICKLGDSGINSQNAEKYSKFLEEAAIVAKFDDDKIVKLRGKLVEFAVFDEIKDLCSTMTMSRFTFASNLWTPS